MADIPHLFRPLRIGDVTLPNRVVLSPMTCKAAIDGVPLDYQIQHYGCFAASAVGTVTLSSTAVSPEGRINAANTGLYNDECEAGLARLITAIRASGPAKIGIQLFHAGRRGSLSVDPALRDRGSVPLEEGGWELIAPSAIPFQPHWRVPKAAGKSDIERLQAAWVDAARRAVRAGVDLVELHSAHGFDLHCWLSPLTNRRDDEYGGDPKRRRRYPLEVIRGIRSVLPDGMPFGIRISATEGSEGGTSEEEVLAYVAEAKAAGIDYICVSAGSSVPKYNLPESPGYLVPYAEKMKREFGLVTRTTGWIVDPRHAERILAEERADLIALARALLDDPRWVWRAAEILGMPPPQARMWDRVNPGRWPGAVDRPRVPAT